MAVLDRHIGKIILITIILTIVFFIALLALLTWQGVNIAFDTIVRLIGNTVENECLNDDLVYRGKATIPNHILVENYGRRDERSYYDKKLATILWDIGGAVSSSNCKGEIPTPLPFTNQYKISQIREKPLLEGWSIPSSRKEITHGYLFWNEDTLCIIFSGTYHPSQWRNNINVDLQNLNIMRNDIPENIKVHSGFIKTYMNIREAIWSWWNNNGNGIKKIVIAGRSLGGALATLCAYDFSWISEHVNIVNYTFASPRVGNNEFCEDFNKKIFRAVRIYNTEDVVIQLPPSVWRKNLYQHVGTSINCVAFTKNMGTLYDNHIEAYRILPE